jgi:hypothetical protein
MAHLHLPPFLFRFLPFVARYECVYECAPHGFSEIGIWDIADRASVAHRHEIETMRTEATTRGDATIGPLGLPPMEVERRLKRLSSAV